MMSYKVFLAHLVASVAHAGQKDKGGYPYISHPVRVSEVLPSKEAKVVGLLHDTLEDTWLPAWVIRLLFGKRVLNSVKALTRRKGTPYIDYIEGVCKDPIALQVKEKDLYDNLDITRLPKVERNYLSTKRRCKKYKEALAVIQKELNGWKS
jgi:guanosine-3',5'-bis(diphosphate) 3'-pyrophosphohydrolase